jgi:hypothetical protein
MMITSHESTETTEIHLLISVSSVSPWFVNRIQTGLTL